MNIAGIISKDYERDFVCHAPSFVKRIHPRDNTLISHLNTLARDPSFSFHGKVDDRLEFSVLAIPCDTRTFHERVVRVLEIEKGLRRYPQMSWKPKVLRMTAMLIDALFAQKCSSSALYVKRKELQFTLPMRSKVVVDCQNDHFFLLPKKNTSNMQNNFNVGRPVFIADLAHDRLLSLWASTPKKRGMQNTSSMVNYERTQAIEELVFKRVKDALPVRVFDYRLPAGNDQSPVRRLAIYERYSGDLPWLLHQNCFVPSESVLQLRLVKKMAQVLLRFHEQDFALRDVKPQNILVNVGEDPRGSDWKLAFSDIDLVIDQRLGIEARPKEAQGTLFYMAPELLMNIMEKKRDHFYQHIALYQDQCSAIDLQNDDMRPADVYALGLVCYPLVFEEPSPWKKEAISQILAAQLSLRLPSQPDSLTKDTLPLFLQYIVLHMLHPQRAQRPSIVDVISFLEKVEKDLDLQK